jgi:hypothetical protein
MSTLLVNNVDFVGKQVRIADINTWAFHAVAAVNFMLRDSTVNCK